MNSTKYDHKHTSKAVTGGSMVFNIFTERFIRVTKTCEAIKSSKPVFLWMTSFAEANQLCICDGMVPSSTTWTLRVDTSCSSDWNEGFKPDGIGGIGLLVWGVGKLVYSGVMAVYALLDDIRVEHEKENETAAVVTPRFWKTAGQERRSGGVYSGHGDQQCSSYG